MTRVICCILVALVSLAPSASRTSAWAESGQAYSSIPPFVTAGLPPMVMLVMARDHKLYYEAYNDASDLDGDGTLDIRYDPDITYYGYFDSYKYYEYDDAQKRFEPAGTVLDANSAPTKKAASGDYWSGDFLNYATMTRMDCLRKVLYGGYRSIDTATETVLRRAYVPRDAHSFGKEYTNAVTDGYAIEDYTPLPQPTPGTRHLFASTTLTDNGDPLLRVLENKSSHIWNWVAKEAPVADNSLGTPKDYVVQVLVGHSSMPESNCKVYPSGAYKPVGVLQRQGESDRIYFGLMTGSYEKNMAGGVLRKNVGSIRDEINPATGQFTAVNGIIQTINKFRVYDYDVANNRYNGGWLVNAPMPDATTQSTYETKKFPDWGNPLAEIMYETVRYFSGAAAPTSEYTYGSAVDLIDNKLGLPAPAWVNPYSASNYCSAPYMLVLSDIYPSYDSDQLPGSSHGSVSTSLTGLNVTTGANLVSTSEGVAGAHFIGQAATYDGACTEKSVTGFGAIRGLCPEEPTKQGGYYSAAVAHYAATHDLNSVTGMQRMPSFMVGLSSPLPKIEIPTGHGLVTVVPFGKTVVAGGMSSAAGAFQPTTTIVDFFVEEISADRKQGKFRINYEDVEQGADHDMDVIVRYEYTVQADDTITISLTKEYQSAGYVLHVGYIISGTTNDGVYLEVSSKPEGDIAYYLDTPQDRTGPGRGTSTMLLSDGVADSGTVYSRARTFSPGLNPAATLLENPLWYAAKWGGFEDKKDAGGTLNGIPDQVDEWDEEDLDGVPDTYFYVVNPTRLEAQIQKALEKILRQTSSGTAAAVVTESRSGEGAVYQALFYPNFRDEIGNVINWAGQVQALWMDGLGNLREDSNGNRALDLVEDRILVYGETSVKRYQDTNGNLILDADNGTGFDELAAVESIGPRDIVCVWSSTPWLNEMADADVVVQRSSYTSTTPNRYILTLADADNDMLADSGEVLDFVRPATPPDAAGLKDPANFYAYLTLFPSFGDTPVAVKAVRDMKPDLFLELLREQSGRVVDYIRGADQANATVSFGGDSHALIAFRSRRADYDNDMDANTWRLGDVAYSTPVLVGRPQENYHLLYKDATYLNFWRKYKSRRQVLYAGANDGMVHAFNGGFYNSTVRSFSASPDGQTAFTVGQELWAYVPYNLLPHLYWLTESAYGPEYHVPYVDLSPRVFDARVFFAADGVSPIDADHPNGWGTVLVCGMRLGGGQIRADLDKFDGDAFNSALDRTMSSAFVVFDVTNPEVAPKVLAELRFPGQGFTTCFPAVMPMASRNAAPDGDNRWYLVLGSGPASATGVADRTMLNRELSDQAGKICVVDFKALASASPQLKSFDTSGDLQSGLHVFATTEVGSFVSDFTAVDLDLDFKTNAVYYGTISGNNTDGRGGMRRLVTGDAPPVAGHVAWTGNATLIDVAQPIMAAPTIAVDGTGRWWVYFGAGRYFNANDNTQTEHMAFYGVREPAETNGTLTWAAVNGTDLYNSTRVSVHDVSGVKSITRDNGDGTNATLTWSSLLADVRVGAGWVLDLPDEGERVLGQASVLGGAVVFSSYIPSLDPCVLAGQSFLNAVYYETGTAFTEAILDIGADGLVTTRVSLGQGMAPGVNLQVGQDGSVIGLTQQDGMIKTEGLTPPLKSNSGRLYWMEN